MRQLGLMIYLPIQHIFIIFKMRGRPLSIVPHGSMNTLELAIDLIIDQIHKMCLVHECMVMLD
jgi:F0F1-type ATP synthase membrane subunit a